MFQFRVNSSKHMNCHGGKIVSEIETVEKVARYFA